MKQQVETKVMLLMMFPVFGLTVMALRSRPAPPVATGPFVLVQNEVTREPLVKSKIAQDEQRQAEEQEAELKRGSHGLRQLAPGLVKINPKTAICHRVVYKMTSGYIYGGANDYMCFDIQRKTFILAVYVARSYLKNQVTEEAFYDMSQFKKFPKAVRCTLSLDVSKDGSQTSQLHKISASINLSKR